ncbi:GNAT family N-acetyltransferase [Candidatus Roizmanbacteria bacterium]|nr:GNAT family N-acetyltransferase [Candidatus Roizmanbacteria bacterium]
MKVTIVDNLKFARWDTFVDKSNNGTIFHKLKFLQYHQKRKFSFFNLVFHEDNNLIAVLPGSLQDGIFKSPVGASYGSFVTKKLSFQKYEELVRCFIEFVKKNKIKEIYMTPPPIIYMRTYDETERFLLSYYGFQPEYHLITSAVNLDFEDKDDDVKYIVSKRLRSNIERSRKNNLMVKFSDDYESFYPILIENKKKFNAKPTHSLDEIITLKQLFPENIKLLMAYDGSMNPIAGIVLFIANSTTVLTFYISHNIKYQNLKPVSRLLYEIALWSRKKGYKWLDFGVSMDTYSKNPMEPSRSLIFFKEGLNTSLFLRTTYHLILTIQTK